VTGKGVATAAAAVSAATNNALVNVVPRFVRASDWTW
jgi:hypothetical protein